ncbi:MAG TPA: hypothetical protein VMV86_04110, partial [Methanosarcinales archaeon]|nr:hypothetical protein [Methanosarcinales archaeon]
MARVIRKIRQTRSGSPISSGFTRPAKPPMDMAALTELLQSQGGKVKTPKASMLQRLSAVWNVGESGEAVYRGLEQGNLGGAIKGYGKSVFEALKTGVVGTPKKEIKKTYKDVLVDFMKWKDRPGKLDASDVVGLAGDIFLDPVTYLSSGTKGVATVAGKVLQKQTIAKAIAKGATREAAEALAKKTVLKKLGAKGVQQAGDIYFGKKLLGNVSKIPGAATASKILIDPIKAIAEPVTSVARKLFKVDTTSAIGRIEQLVKRRADSGVTFGEMATNQIRKLLKGSNLTDDEALNIINKIEVGGGGKLDKKLEPVYKEVSEIIQATNKKYSEAGLPVLEDIAYFPREHLKYKTDMEAGASRLFKDPRTKHRIIRKAVQTGEGIENLEPIVAARGMGGELAKKSKKAKSGAELLGSGSYWHYGDQTTRAKFAQSSVDGIPNTKAVKDLIEGEVSRLKEGLGGVTKVATDDGGYIRQSANPEWYRKFYKENKRKPNAAEWLEMAKENIFGTNKIDEYWSQEGAEEYINEILKSPPEALKGRKIVNKKFFVEPNKIYEVDTKKKLEDLLKLAKKNPARSKTIIRNQIKAKGFDAIRVSYDVDPNIGMVFVSTAAQEKAEKLAKQIVTVTPGMETIIGKPDAVGL